jgi:hypothetical protein
MEYAEGYKVVTFADAAPKPPTTDERETIEAASEGATPRNTPKAEAETVEEDAFDRV